MTYKEKLRDPRWQKKRLEILNRDAFTCQFCGDVKTTLHIHHKEYVNSNPWDISNELLITLCELCHFIVEDFKRIGTKLEIKQGGCMLLFTTATGQRHDVCNVVIKNTINDNDVFYILGVNKVTNDILHGGHGDIDALKNIGNKINAFLKHNNNGTTS